MWSSKRPNDYKNGLGKSPRKSSVVSGEPKMRKQQVGWLDVRCPPTSDAACDCPILYATFVHILTRLISLREVILNDVPFCTHMIHPGCEIKYRTENFVIAPFHLPSQITSFANQVQCFEFAKHLSQMASAAPKLHSLKITSNSKGDMDDSDWDKIFPIDDRLGRYALTHTKITTLMLSTEVEVMTFLPHIERIVELCPGLKRLHIHHYDNWSAGPFQPCVDLCGKRSDFQSDGRWRMRIPL